MSLLAAIYLEPGGIIAWLFVGLIAGFLAGKFMRGSGYGIIGDIILGLIGAFSGRNVVRLLRRGPIRPDRQHRHRLYRGLSPHYGCAFYRPQ